MAQRQLRAPASGRSIPDPLAGARGHKSNAVSQRGNGGNKKANSKALSGDSEVECRVAAVSTGSTNSRSTSSGSATPQAQDEPERSRMGQGPEHVEGLAGGPFSNGRSARRPASANPCQCNEPRPHSWATLPSGDWCRSLLARSTGSGPRACRGAGDSYLDIACNQSPTICIDTAKAPPRHSKRRPLFFGSPEDRFRQAASTGIVGM